MVFGHTVRTVECVVRRVSVKRDTVTCRKTHAERWTDPRAVTSETLIGQWQRICWQVQRPGSERISQAKPKLRFSYRMLSTQSTERLSKLLVGIEYETLSATQLALCICSFSICSLLLRSSGFPHLRFLSVTLVLCIESR